MNVLGFDVGTYNLISCSRQENNYEYKREVNGFVKLNIESRAIFNMMEKSGVKLVEFPDENVAYALGKNAVEMARTLPNVELLRPMKDGCLNPKEHYAQEIMSMMIHGMIGEIEQDNTTLFYSVPANALNEETDADYHQKVLQQIFDDYESDQGFKLDARPINEALALVYAELEEKAWTGIGISCGSGMVNICYSIFGAPVFQFSIVNSGDWIDKQASKALGETTTTYVNRQKEKIDFTIQQDELVFRAIKTQYEIMIHNTVNKIVEGFEKAGHNTRTDKPVDIILAGGTATPNGFEELFKEALNKVKLPIKVGEIIKPKEPVKSVARGCLVAAENA